MPLISIIIPVYNAERYLSECLESIRTQVFDDIEVICINDGSTDGTCSIIKKIIKKDSRFHLYTKNNTGAGDSRNLGIQIAKGEYLWFVDADDWVGEEAFSILSEILKKNRDIDVLIFNAGICIENQVFKGCYLFEQAPSNNNFLNSSTSAPWNKLFRRKFILDKNILFQNLASCNDIAFVGIALTLADDIIVVDKDLYFYRKDSLGAISRARSDKALNVYKAAYHMKDCLISSDKFKPLYFYDFISSCVAYEFNNSFFFMKLKLLQRSFSFFPSRYLILKILRKLKRKINNWF